MSVHFHILSDGFRDAICCDLLPLSVQLFSKINAVIYVSKTHRFRHAPAILSSAYENMEAESNEDFH